MKRKCTCMLAHLLYYASKETNYLIQFGLGYQLTNQVIKDAPPMATYPSRCLDTLTANDLATRILTKTNNKVISTGINEILGTKVSCKWPNTYCKSRTGSSYVNVFNC